jgi:hypothetical protein
VANAAPRIALAVYKTIFLLRGSLRDPSPCEHIAETARPAGA